MTLFVIHRLSEQLWLLVRGEFSSKMLMTFRKRRQSASCSAKFKGEYQTLVVLCVERTPSSEDMRSNAWCFLRRRSPDTRKSLSMSTSGVAAVVFFLVALTTSVSSHAAASTFNDHTSSWALLSDDGVQVSSLKSAATVVSCPSSAPCELKLGQSFGNTWIRADAGDLKYFTVSSKPMCGCART